MNDLIRAQRISAQNQKNSPRTTNINLNGYTIEHTPTEANCGGAVLYIEKSVNYTIR